MNTPDLASLFPSFDPALATFLHDSFDVPKESHSTLCAALINARYRTWSDFLYIEHIHDLAYHDGSARVPLTRHFSVQDSHHDHPQVFLYNHGARQRVFPSCPWFYD
eukprot:jgi/Psemu1/19588/gm1.19588_g